MDAATLICPSCQQDALLKGEAQYVCINCGYITETPPVSPEETSSKKAAKKADPEQVAEVHSSPPAESEGRLMTSPSSPNMLIVEGQPGKRADMVQPQHNNKVVIERKLEKVVGHEKAHKVHEQLEVVSGVSKGFVSTYREEMDEIFGSTAIKAFKVVMFLLAGLAIAFLLYTFLQ